MPSSQQTDTAEYSVVVVRFGDKTTMTLYTENRNINVVKYHWNDPLRQSPILIFSLVANDHSYRLLVGTIRLSCSVHSTLNNVTHTYYYNYFACLMPLWTKCKGILSWWPFLIFEAWTRITVAWPQQPDNGFPDSTTFHTLIISPLKWITATTSTAFWPPLKMFILTDPSIHDCGLLNACVELPPISYNFWSLVATMYFRDFENYKLQLKLGF